MASINEHGNVSAKCPGCSGAISVFVWKTNNGQHGAIENLIEDRSWRDAQISYRLFKCSGCNRGSLGTVLYGGDYKYPGLYRRLINFRPESGNRLSLPHGVPHGIKKEFEEGEMCIETGCIRAAAGMFRSVLDKTLRANGYKLKDGTNLEQQIDMAAKDGVITEPRRKKAHEDIRVLGNDVLHDEWQEIPIESVQLAQHYCQRILEDFYDDRKSVLDLLRTAKRIPEEDKTQNSDE